MISRSALHDQVSLVQSATYQINFMITPRRDESVESRQWQADNRSRSPKSSSGNGPAKAQKQACCVRARTGKQAGKEASKTAALFREGSSRFPVLLSRVMYVSPDVYVDRRKKGKWRLFTPK